MSYKSLEKILGNVNRGIHQSILESLEFWLPHRTDGANPTKLRVMNTSDMRNMIKGQGPSCKQQKTKKWMGSAWKVSTGFSLVIIQR